MAGFPFPSPFLVSCNVVDVTTERREMVHVDLGVDDGKEDVAGGGRGDVEGSAVGFEVGCCVSIAILAHFRGYHPSDSLACFDCGRACFLRGNGKSCSGGSADDYDGSPQLPLVVGGDGDDYGCGCTSGAWRWACWSSFAAVLLCHSVLLPAVVLGFCRGFGLLQGVDRSVGTVVSHRLGRFFRPQGGRPSLPVGRIFSLGRALPLLGQRFHPGGPLDELSEPCRGAPL